MSMATAQYDGGSFASSDEDRMIALLRDVRDAAAPPSVEEIARVLATTLSFRLRNAAALALADLGGREGSEWIGAVLGRPDVAPQSGTLLFALDELGGRLPFESLVNIVRHGSFEGRSEALNLLDAGRVASADPAAHRRALEDLASIAVGADHAAAEVAREALAILSAASGGPDASEHRR
ncbi:hypothetical protein [Methylobacterium sp. J-076]|uniref:hypothetical protein n=1 Tax=Methylobacterium sp. J-076 TaxID=2836655 RepID=UPI001FBBA552|nr:hypothetical protein [Methylobacterium sp. J-076]MCJ2013183.1 hypothetical protein [Methylobacterium sp. J-076]